LLLKLQSPAARALKVEAGKENPNLTDNWDDAEGYYSKIIILIRNTIKQNLRGHSEIQILVVTVHAYVNAFIK